jgi:TonB family protein
VDCTRGPARLGSNDHGPLPYYHPTPRLPDSLTQDKLEKCVLIEFSVSSDANTSSQLVSSSGNKSLDALAMDTARQWKFYPAEAGGRPVDSRVRLKINFQVL